MLMIYTLHYRESKECTHSSHSLGSLKHCRVYIINRTPNATYDKCRTIVSQCLSQQVSGGVAIRYFGSVTIKTLRTPAQGLRA